MKLETIKTFILVILVGLSLLLTFSLWNYQPDYELHYPQSKYVNEVDLGGIEASKKTIIQPKTIVFHNGDDMSGYAQAEDQRNLYKSIQQWSLDDPLLQEDNDLASDKMIEIVFPLAIPMELTRSLFVFTDEQQQLPIWSFQQIFITFNEADSNLYVYFRSSDEQQQMRFTVHDSDAYRQLAEVMNDNKELVPYISYGSNHPIYIPAEQLEMNRRSLSVKTIEPTLLVNALFRNPSLVSPNIGEAYFTDGQRGMHVKQEGRSMEFINPISPTDEQMNFIELLDLSLADINGHKGWTDLYTLSDVNEMNSKVKFQMEYDGYPVHSSGNLSIIEQVWQDHELHQYIRPLFSLNNILGVEAVHIPPGKDIIYYLNNNKSYEEADIWDIQIGYRLTYMDGATFSVTLEPTWLINHKGDWVEVKLDDVQVNEEGGA